MVRRRSQVVAAGLAAVLAGLLLVSPGPALGQPWPRGRIRERCESVLPRAKVAPIVARYRDRIVTARQTVGENERALRALLIADNSTRAALDAQIAKTEAARSALSRVRVDLLWELRSVVPAADRGLAFRCVAFYMRRR